MNANNKTVLDLLALIHSASDDVVFRHIVVGAIEDSGLLPAGTTHNLAYDFATEITTSTDRTGADCYSNNLMIGPRIKDFHKDLPTAQYSLAGGTEPTVLSQFLGRRQIRETALYHEINKPLGTLDVLYFPYAHADLLYGVVLTREVSFKESERQLAALLQQHMRSAFRNHCMLRHAGKERDLLLGKEHMLVLDYSPSLFELWPDVVLDRWSLSSMLPKEPPVALSVWLKKQAAHYPFSAVDEDGYAVVGCSGRPLISVHFLGGIDQRHKVAVEVHRTESNLAAAFNLSRREVEVLRWVCDGKDNAEIATILGISRNTIRNHVASILDKLMVENRMSAAVLVGDWFAA